MECNDTTLEMLVLQTNNDPNTLDELQSGEANDVNDLEINDILDLPDTSYADVNPQKNPLLWVQTQIERCADPKSILNNLVPSVSLPDDITEISVWRLIFEIIAEPAPRQPLPHVSSLDNVVRLIKDCRKIVILTGAGVSVSCGIPDFRSRDGIYARLTKDFPSLPDPQSMFDIKFFRVNPNPFFRFAKEIYPGSFKPSLSHRFIQQLEASGRLLRNYTQNIDTLERVAGINNVVYCHGSFATASCMNCKIKVNAEDIKEDIFTQNIPYCKRCTVTADGASNILKPDIVFFGEGLSEDFHNKVKSDKEAADLLIVIGSSLKVRPVALIPSLLKPTIPQILINRESLPHMQFDVELYGNCDDVLHHLCSQLGADWEHVTESHVSHPVECDKYRFLYDLPNSSTQQVHELSTVIPPCDPSHLVRDNGVPTDSVKRKLSLSDDESNQKHLKIYSDHGPSVASGAYYLFYPPNSYIFHGAEISFSDDTSSEEESSTELANYENKDNLLTVLNDQENAQIK